MSKLTNILKNKDGVIAYLPLGCGLLYAIGGSGCIAIRRYVLPLYIGILLFWLLGDLVKALWSILGVVLLSASLHLGYGDEIASQNILMLALISLAWAVGTLGFWFAYSKKKFHLFLRLFIPSWFLWSCGASNGWFGYSMEWKLAEMGLGLIIGTVCLIDCWGKWR